MPSEITQLGPAAPGAAEVDPSSSPGAQTSFAAHGAAAAAVAALRARVGGRVLADGDEGYVAAHRVWNADRQSRPAAVVRCMSSDDVVATIDIARAHGLPLAVRGGGYGPSGSASCEGGVVIDTRMMTGVTVQRANRGTAMAVVRAGATWGDVDPVTQSYGLAVPGLPVSTIGVVGSTITGGYGHLRRTFGLACDSLVSADLITADGMRITASGDRRPELLWGLRGGGGNFGVLTSLTFRLRPLPDPVLSGAIFVRAEHAGDLLRFYRDYTAGLPDDVSTTFSLLSAQHSTMLTHMVGVLPSVRVATIVVVCTGSPAASSMHVAALRRATPVLLDTIGRYPYAQLQGGAASGYLPGRPAAVDSGFVGGLDDELIDGLIDRHAAMPPDSCEIQIDHMGGAVGRVAPMSTAAPNRGAPYVVRTTARWHHADRADEQRRWFDGTRELVGAHAVGGPHVGVSSRPVDSEQVYGRERYLRLAALKGRYDPDNVFAGNQNIAPLS